MTTTTLYDIIQSELINAGKNEFFNDNQLTFSSNEYAFIEKIMYYDEDVQEIVNTQFFKDVTMSTPEIDFYFKKMFINKFYAREIGRQTTEAFAGILTHTTMKYKPIIDNLFEHMNEYVNGSHVTEINGTGGSTNKNRSAFQDLPQDCVNVDLNDDTFEFATNNTISLTENEDNSNQITKSNSYDASVLTDIMNQIDRLFNKFDRQCFLQVWG